MDDNTVYAQDSEDLTDNDEEEDRTNINQFGIEDENIDDLEDFSGIEYGSSSDEDEP